MTSPAARLEAGLRELGIDASPAARETLLAHLHLVREANRRLNLTRITDPEIMIRDLLLDSLALLAALRDAGHEPEPGSALLDVGSGAGFPGIPITAARPDLRVTLVEGRGKKAAFLAEAVRELGLGAVGVVAVRAELLVREDPARRGAFRTVVARAVGPVERVVREAAELVAPGGVLVHVKGPGLGRDEIEAGDREAAAAGLAPARIVPTRQVDRGTRFVIQVRPE